MECRRKSAYQSVCEWVPEVPGPDERYEAGGEGEVACGRVDSLMGVVEERY